jgi:hypothetical protein
MADERLDDLDRRLRELEARVAGLSAETETIRDAVVAVGGPFGADDSTATDDTGSASTESDAASWTDPALRADSAAVVDRSGAVEGTDGPAAGAERDIVMAPPKGASQAAVERAVDEVERARDHEENLVM